MRAAPEERYRDFGEQSTAAMTSWRPDPGALRGRIAVVAGATRGAGRGIAAALGEAGATVICSGRSSRGRAGRSDYERAETIEETAELVTSLGGNGIPFVVDHLDSSHVKRLSSQIRDTHGQVDILVNDLWAAELLKGRRSDRRNHRLQCVAIPALWHDP
jgi:NAD(P)-dependent dehydrogenase (short-subunit alcohol dehydrogenase family)